MIQKQAYPLDWPQGWRRTSSSQRSRASFGKKQAVFCDQYDHSTVSMKRVRIVDRLSDLTLSQAIERLFDELHRMGVAAEEIVISTNIQLRLDGMPRGGLAPPEDPGVAVYWRHGKQTRCMAVDRYDRVPDNLAAIAATLNAMRAIERHGGATILDRAFTGFVALPAPEQAWQVLGLKTSKPTRQQVVDAHRRLAMEHHPDRGGDDRQMGRINAARDELLENLI